MRIYQAEKEAGIDFQMDEVGNSIALVTAKVRIDDIEKYFDGISAADLMKMTNTVQTVEELLGQEQPDLALIVAILVSTGWNDNDDIFTPEEVWKAKSSPLHKPMNDNHNEEKILGHIVQSRALDKSGNEIELSKGEIPPDEFDIEVAGVLYKMFPKLAERINEIITKAKAGEIFVSMEAWFPDFGYGLVNPATGETKLIERNENTAFLTKHLRIYKGSGEYQGYKIGRVLKNIIFGAQGFVDTPANLESVIKVAANKVAAPKVFVTAKLSELSEGGVEDVDEKQLKELQTKLEETQASLTSKEQEIAELQKAVEEFKTKDYDGQIAALTTNVTEASEKVEAVEAEKTELQKQLDEVTERAEKSEAELEGIRRNEIARERLAKLSEVKKIEDDKATLAELHEMTDETFEVVLKYAGEAKSSEATTDTTETNKESKTAEQEEAERAEAALNSAEEESDSADLNATDANESETDQWVSTAQALCGREEKKE